MINIAILCSGEGTNMDYIHKACLSGVIPGRVCVVISDRMCGGIDKARSYGIPAHVVSINAALGTYLREMWNSYIIDLLKYYEIDLVCLAGFMKILSSSVINTFPNKILNLHPGILPLLAGKDPQKKALNMHLKETGNTIHIVTNKLDEGPILATDTVYISNNDTEETLSKKLKETGYSTYIQAIQFWIKNYYKELSK